jgi:uncharacterized coiled-coil protein SlyX
MIDLSYSHQRDQEDRAAVWARRQRMIIPLVAASILLGGGLLIVWGFGGTRVLTPSPRAVSAPAREQVSSELLETTKGLEVTQQQAVDQLQVVQDQLVAQQTETKKLSEQIATLTEKLDALQQSVANIPAPSVAAPLPTPKAPPSKK